MEGYYLLNLLPIRKSPTHSSNGLSCDKHLKHLKFTQTQTMKTSFLLSIALLLSLSTYSQNERDPQKQKTIDSLWGEWHNENQSDSLRLAAINHIAWDGYLFTHPDSAFQFAQMQYDYAASINYEKFMADALNIQAISYAIRSNHEKALEYYNKCLDVPIISESKKNKANVLGNIAALHKDQGKYDEALQYYNKVLYIHQEANHQKGIATALYSIGAVYMERGDLKTAMEYEEKSLQLFEELKLLGETAMSLTGIGNIFSKQGQGNRAIEYFYRAIKLQEQLGNQLEVATIQVNIANLYHLQEDYEKALEYLNKSLVPQEKAGDQYHMATGLYSIGRIYIETSELDKALEVLNRSLEIRENIGDEQGVANSSNAIGSIYSEKEDFTKALSFYNKGLKIFEASKNSTGISLSLSSIGEVFYTQNKTAKALSYSQRALDIAQASGDVPQIVDATKTLWKNHKTLGNFKQALQMHELYTTMLDSITNEENQRATLREEYKYTYEKRALADSLAFVQKEAIKDLELREQEATLSLQRVALISSILGLLLLTALVYFIFKGRKQARAEAEHIKELDTFKTRLYTNITHEFRTPLTVILGMADQVESQPKAYLKEGVQLIRRNGRHLLRLINQLLDLSKLENHSFQLQLQQSNLIPYLHYLTESFHSFANSKNLALRFFSKVETQVMDYDLEQIKQVMTNLISNAVKFTPSGGEVLVRVSSESQQLTIEVKDTGLGIAATELPNIFDRFYQVDNPTSRSGEGTGIGLAHTKELVKLMGGNISVTSEVGKGSSFIISLPIRNTAEIVESFNSEVISEKPVLVDRQENIGKAAVAKIGEQSNSSTLPQVLIIEDNPDVVIYLKSCLEGLYQIDVAYNGRIGIEKALETVPDLIISDVMMPEKDGFEVCDILKNDERSSHIPIILLTAKADAASKLAGLQRGADAYLAKPFDKEELLVRLENLIELRARMKAFFIDHLQQLPAAGISFAQNDEATSVENAFLEKIKTILETHISDEDFGLPQLCQKIGMSRSQLFRKMKALADTAPSQFIKTYRLNKAKYLLEHSDMNVAEVAYEVGFKDPSYFSKIFQEAFGLAPSATNK